MSRSDSTPEDELPRYSAKKLKLIRKWDLGMSKEQLAEAMGCDVRSVTRYEKDTPLPAKFIRVVERLRVQERARRARELGEEEIDWASLSTPGLKLIELRPVRRLAGKLFQMFIALPKDWIRSDDESGQLSPSPVPESGDESSGRSAHPATRTEIRMIAAGMAIMACCLFFGSVGLLREEIWAAVRTGRSFRVAREAKIERQEASPAPKRVPEATDDQEPVYVPAEFYTNSPSDESDNVTPKLKRIQMPKQPYSWQKLAPCSHGEVEKIGACWIEAKGEPPCSNMAVQSDNSCFVPVRAEPPKPNTVESKK